MLLKASTEAAGPLVELDPDEHADLIEQFRALAQQITHVESIAISKQEDAVVLIVKNNDRTESSAIYEDGNLKWRIYTENMRIVPPKTLESLTEEIIALADLIHERGLYTCVAYPRHHLN